MAPVRNIVFLIIILLVGCVSVRVNTESSEGFFLNHYKTYNYNVDHYSHGDTSIRINGELAYFKDKFDELLRVNGLRIGETPEILLNLDVVFEERRKTRSGGDPGYDKSYAGDIRPDHNRAEYVTVYYDIGTLTVEFVDIQKNEVVFHGTAFGIDARNSHKIIERIDATIEKMFLDMPKK